MRKRQRTETVVEVDFRRLGMLAVTVALCLLAVLSLVFYVRGLMRVRNFTVSGISQYELNEIVNASGVKRGDLLYSMKKKEIAEKILKGCPYLESVDVEARFPGTVYFRVTERRPQWYIEISGDYYALDANLVVIAESSSAQNLIDGNTTKLILPYLQSAISGELPKFGSSENEVRRVLEVISTVRQTSFKSRITMLDVDKLTDIRLSVDGSYEVSMGGTKDLEAKLRAVEKILDSEQAKEYSAAEIDVSVPSAISFKPITQKKTETTG